MKLYELTDILYLKRGNARVYLDVVTIAYAIKYGTLYENKLSRFGGVCGRLSDIPAYLGGCDVVDYDADGDVINVTI